jgi:hypothetical protein
MPPKTKPEVNIDAPATSIEEYFKINLLRKRTAIAKPNAERIASISPKLIIDNNEDTDVEVVFTALLLLTTISTSLAKAIKNPMSPILIPIIWNLFNLSFKNILARTTIMTISIGPAMRASFDAPIRLMESYHVNIPSESDKDANIRIFHDLVKRIGIGLFLLKKKAATINSIIPANVMLVAESIIGENCRKDVVKYSIMMDSTEMANA